MLKKSSSARKKMLITLVLCVALIATAFILSFTLSNDLLRTNDAIKRLPPCARHLFGTDNLGRDMFARTLKALRLSLGVGLLGAMGGAVIATVLGFIAAMSNRVNAMISWLVDMFIGMPHLIFIILISFMLGGGVKGVICGVALTHWPSLTRVTRNEVLSIKNSEYIQIARNLGKSHWYIATRHIMPHVIPQVMVGFLLLFPHAIVHEAAITFLGFGLSVQTPSIGLILSDAVKHISVGDWWLVVFPGALLILIVKSFDSIGEQLRILTDPSSANE